MKMINSNNDFSGKPFNMPGYIHLYNKEAPQMKSKSKKNILHYPQLDTVLMVEEFIKEHSGEYKKRALWEHLPKKMMYQTFQIVYDYLFDSQKIARDLEGKICWIWNPELVRKYMQNESLFVR
jgi:hypothetical protein